MGRTDDMFVSGGENIFPGDVEKMLETHPDVVQACVVPVDDDIKGTKPVAFVVRREGSQLDEATLKAYALKNVPAYQHPAFHMVYRQPALASTNKLDRNTLRSLAASKLGRGMQRRHSKAEAATQGDSADSLDVPRISRSPAPGQRTGRLP